MKLALQGGTKQGLALDDVANLVVPVPDRFDQARRLSEMDGAWQRVSALRREVALAVNRLLEMRSALISAAVTGQIDVREGTGFDSQALTAS